MAKRRSFGPFVLVFTALSCSMYVACGDDDYIIPPAAGAGGTSDAGPGGSGGTSGSAGTAGTAGTGTGAVDGGTTPDAAALPDGAVDDAGDDAATSNN
jgi:hypothetical protein